MRNRRKGFSVVLAIVVTAFLTILSAGVLDLVMREMKTSSAYWHGVSTQAGAEGSLEWALLKLKNHREGFQDSVVFGVDKESLLLSGKKEFAQVGRNDQILEYEMSARSGSYLGTVDAHGFDVLPLFYDSGALATAEGNASAFKYDPAQMVESLKLSLASPRFDDGDPAGLVWNIVGTRTFLDDGTTPVTSGETDGIAGTSAFDSQTGTGVAKKALAQEGSDVLETSVDRLASIKEFMERHAAKYLIVYNFNDQPVTYDLAADVEQFALPETEIFGSSTMGDFKQTLRFGDSRKALFSGLKYSLFSAQ